MVIGKCKSVFRGIFFLGGGGGGVSGGRVTLEDIFMEEFVLGEENFNEEGAGFSSIIKNTMKK